MPVLSSPPAANARNFRKPALSIADQQGSGTFPMKAGKRERVTAMLWDLCANRG